MKGRKRCGKRRKCWLPAFCPFPTVFSQACFLKFVKSQQCTVGLKPASRVNPTDILGLEISQKMQFNGCSCINCLTLADSVNQRSDCTFRAI